MKRQKQKRQRRAPSWQFLYYKAEEDWNETKVYQHCSRGRALARMAEFVLALPETEEENESLRGPWRVDSEVRRFGLGARDEDIGIKSICPDNHPLLAYLA